MHKDMPHVDDVFPICSGMRILELIGQHICRLSDYLKVFHNGIVEHLVHKKILSGPAGKKFFDVVNCRFDMEQPSAVFRLLSHKSVAFHGLRCLSPMGKGQSPTQGPRFASVYLQGRSPSRHT